MGVSFVTKYVAGFPFGFDLCARLSSFNEFKVGCGPVQPTVGGYLGQEKSEKADVLLAPP